MGQPNLLTCSHTLRAPFSLLSVWLANPAFACFLHEHRDFSIVPSLLSHLGFQVYVTQELHPLPSVLGNSGYPIEQSAPATYNASQRPAAGPTLLPTQISSVPAEDERSVSVVTCELALPYPTNTLPSLVVPVVSPTARVPNGLESYCHVTNPR